ncbi:hypothetical protein OJAV_G00185720 [Oryzias javanicus]|uniref:High mobility group protein B2 n=1 Tax=Oryzias javanicus TaxID=123683 RepID=A0A3S2U1Y9_ORYJA|nr:hypothetical protein OJAV_G00185720 [Oryzias javanicus]
MLNKPRPRGQHRSRPLRAKGFGGVPRGRGYFSCLKVHQRLRFQNQKHQQKPEPGLCCPPAPLRVSRMMRKDVNKPKGKTSAYAFFVQTCREEHRKKNPEQSVNFAEFSKKCSERWKALSPSDKKCFEDMAKADKVRYNREMRDYVPPKGFGKRGRKRKDPNAPKRPPSAFFVFCSEYRPSVKQQYPGLSIGDCAKKLGEMWSKLSQSEKQPYEEKAQKLREKYDRDMVAYRGGGTYARNPGSSAQGAEEEEDEDGEEDEEEEEDE